jgi:hypothetical protein
MLDLRAMIRGITNFQTEICQQCCLILWYLKMIIMPRDESTKIATDGLRYKSKEAGSPFGGSSSMATMSCYKCGLHKPRSLGVFKKLAGQNMFCCGECSPKK